MSELFFGPIQEVEEEPTKSFPSLVETYSLALDKDPTEVEQAMQAGLFKVLEEEAKTRANAKAEEALNTTTRGILEEQPEDAIERLTQAVEDTPDLDHVAPDYATIMAGRPGATKSNMRITEREAALDRMITERLGESSEGFFPTVGYFLDTGVSSIAQSVLGVPSFVVGVGDEVFESGFQLAEYAKELSVLAADSNVSSEEFIERASYILDQVQDAGLFTEVNPFYLTTFREMVKEGGRGAQTLLEQTLSIVDITPFGLLGKAGTASKASRLGTRTGSTGRNVAKVSDNETAIELIARSTNPEVRLEGTTPDIIAPMREGTEYFAGPELAAARRVEAENAALDRWKSEFKGQVIKQETIEKETPRILQIVEDKISSYKRKDMAIDVITNSDNSRIWGRAVFGKTDKTPFVKLEAAQKLADDLAGEVLRQPDGKFVVVKDFDIPTSGLADPTDIKQVTETWVSRLFSTTFRTAPELDSMLKRAEALGSKVAKDIITDLNKARKGADVNNVNAIVKDLRDNPVENSRTQPLSGEEFADAYFNRTGKTVDNPTAEYYSALLRASDLDYYLTADRILKKAIDNKEEVLVWESGVTFRVKRVAPDNEAYVYDTASNELKQYKNVTHNHPVFEVQGASLEVPGVTGGIRYVTGPSLKTRRLYHTDVLSYNAGGHRMYADRLEFFVKQSQDDITLAGGGTMSRNPVTFMGVRTRTQAQKAVKEFNTIVEAINKKASNINDVILENNGWNRSIENLEDFKAFAKDHGLDITKKVDFAADGEALPADVAKWAGEDTYDQSFVNRITNSQRGRGSRPLIGYGGETLETLDPSEAVSLGAVRSGLRAANEAYMYNAVNGWIGAAKASDALPTEAYNMTPNQLLRYADESKLRKTSPAYDALVNERLTILFRQGVLNQEDLSLQKIIRRGAEAVYGDGNKLGKALDRFADLDPAGQLRAIAFHTKLGMFNPDQLIVQSSQIINIVGTGIATVGPTSTIRAMTSVPAIRIGLMANDNLLKWVANAQSTVSGIDPNDFIELVKYLKKTGRNIVDNTVVEENNAYAMWGGKFKKYMDYGQVFFREGELVARLGAAALDVVERRAKYGMDVNIWDGTQANSMIRRQDILTASMTSASAAPWQRSAFAIPLQFTTYMVRMYEQLFTNRILTPKERISVGLTHLALYGGAAVPAVGFALDRMHYEDPNALTESDALRDVIRYGMLDGIILQFLTGGAETAMSTRLAVGEGTWDFFYNALFEDKLVETLIGPGGEITSELFLGGVRMLSNMAQGNFDYLSYDWQRFARNISSVNKAYNTYWAAKYGEYYSRKTLERQDINMTTPEVFATFLGIPLEEQDRIWATIGNTVLDKGILRRVTKDIQKDFNLAKQAMDEDDFDKYESIMNNAMGKMELLSVSEQQQVWSVLRRDSSLPASVINNMIRQGRTGVARQIAEGIVDGS